MDDMGIDPAARNSLVSNQFRLSNIPFHQNDSEQRNRPENVYNQANWIRSKSSIPLGCVEILISISLFSGFVGPLKLSSVYIIWLFTFFGIVFGFSGVLSILYGFSYGTFARFLNTTRFIVSIVTFAFVCLGWYIAAFLTNEEEWNGHWVILILMITMQGMLSIHTFIVMLGMLINAWNEDSSKHELVPSIDPETTLTVSEVPLPNEVIPSMYGLDESRRRQGQQTNSRCYSRSISSEAPDIPPPIYSEIRSSFVYEGMA